MKFGSNVAIIQNWVEKIEIIEVIPRGYRVTIGTERGTEKSGVDLKCQKNNCPADHLTDKSM